MKQTTISSSNSYCVFPGAEITYLDIQAEQYSPCLHNRSNIIEMNYCLEGRSECVMNDGCLQYIGEGDLFLNLEKNHSTTIELPLGYYKGLFIELDVNLATSVLPGVIPEVFIDLPELVERYFCECGCYLIQAREELRQIFSSLFTAPEQSRDILCQLKMQELLLYLRYFDPTGEKQKKVYARQQVNIVKQIQKQLTENLKERFTIEELGRKYCISPTALKSNFKGVYGISIAAYMKEYRIQQAANLLRYSPKSIAEIAAEIGYESQSKFGAAFKDTAKISPLEYRKKYQTGG